MMKNNKRTAMSIPGGVALSGLAALCLTLICGLVVSRLVEQGRLPMERTGYVLMGVLVAVSFFGALIGSGKVKHRKVLVCAACGAVYFGILMCVTALFYGGRYGGVWETALMIVLGTGAAALIAGRPGETGKSRKKKH